MTSYLYICVKIKDRCILLFFVRNCTVTVSHACITPLVWREGLKTSSVYISVQEGLYIYYENILQQSLISSLVGSRRYHQLNSREQGGGDPVPILSLLPIKFNRVHIEGIRGCGSRCSPLRRSKLAVGLLLLPQPTPHSRDVDWDRCSRSSLILPL